MLRRLTSRREELEQSIPDGARKFKRQKRQLKLTRYWSGHLTG
jgi:hypothetical protein